MDFEKLTPEQIEHAKTLQTPAELLAFAEKEGLALSEEELNGISGGGWERHDCGKHHCESDTCVEFYVCTENTCGDQFCLQLNR